MPEDDNQLKTDFNAAIKRMLLNHRGIPERHMKYAHEKSCHTKNNRPGSAHIL